MAKQRTPSFKEWEEANYMEPDWESSAHQVIRIFPPDKYPTWTFCTEAFRLTLRLPEGFEQGLRSYTELKSENGWPLKAVMVMIRVYRGKAELHADAKDVGALTKEELPYYSFIEDAMGSYVLAEIPEARNGKYSRTVPTATTQFLSTFLTSTTGVDAVPKTARRGKRPPQT